MRPLTALLYLLLALAGVPWYWPPDDDRLLFGMPLWAAVAVLCSVLVSALTVIELMRPWPGEGEEDGRPE